MAIPQAINAEDLPKIEAEMKKIVKENLPIVHETLSHKEAKEMFKDDKYKCLLIDAVSEDEALGIYTQGEYKDVCRGPHVMSTGLIKHFKLLSVAGAYWRGDSKMKCLLVFMVLAGLVLKILKVFTNS